MSLLQPSDAQRIEQAIAQVEQHTAGEIVVMLVRQSDRYDGPRAMVAGLWAVAFAAIALLWGPWHLAPLWVVVAQLPFAGLLWGVLGWRPLRRLLVPRDHAVAAVSDRAQQAFMRRGVHETRDRSGLLIFLSELEQRVEIIGDRGIHLCVGNEGWSAHVRSIVESIRAGRTADGIIAVIEAIGQVLARDFPRRPDDTNELPNQVIH